MKPSLRALTMKAVGMVLGLAFAIALGTKGGAFAATEAGQSAEEVAERVESEEAVEVVAWSVVKPGVLQGAEAGIQWTQHDNRADVDWRNAGVYCAALTLDGGGWRLPTHSELKQLYSAGADAKVSCGRGNQCNAPVTFRLSSHRIWTSHPGKASTPRSPRAWYLSLEDGQPHYGEANFPYHNRALCVRQRP